jgi:hypothetical protein
LPSFVLFRSNSYFVMRSIKNTWFTINC